MAIFGRDAGKSSGRVDFLIVGLGNPDEKHAKDRHNIGFEVATALAVRWQLPKFKKKFAGLVTDGRTGPGGPKVAVLMPQTYMNDAGRSVGPAAGTFKLQPERVVVVHDEIDLPFGDVRSRTGGGMAGHNGLKSVRVGLASGNFERVRVGVGRPDSTDPEIVSAYVLSKFKEQADEVEALVVSACDAVEEYVGSA